MTETTDSVNDQDGQGGAATPWADAGAAAPWAELDGSARPAACTDALTAIAGWTPTPPPPTNPYSDAEDERILFLRDACRWTWPRIAADLGRPSEAVVRRRYLRLSRIYAFDPSLATRPFSAQEDAELLRLREELEWTWQRIADQLGRPSGACVRMRYGNIQQRRALARKARRQQTARRQCIDCPGWIVSTGAGHRRCDDCRARVAATPWDA